MKWLSIVSKTSVIISLLLLFFTPLNASTKGNQKVRNFRQAKKLIAKVYRDHKTTFYCGCEYKNRKIFNQTCGYIPKKNSEGKTPGRAFRLEWEHIVPASRFTNGLRRRNARKTSREFNFMEADLYNLVPAIGQLNELRSNYNFGIIEGESREFGACDFETKRRKAEPKPDIIGDIARIYFYMASSYPRYFALTDEEKEMFAEWDASDPVDEWERKRAKMIEKIQGNRNRFVK